MLKGEARMYDLLMYLELSQVGDEERRSGRKRREEEEDLEEDDPNKLIGNPRTCDVARRTYFERGMKEPVRSEVTVALI